MSNMTVIHKSLILVAFIFVLLCKSSLQVSDDSDSDGESRDGATGLAQNPTSLEDQEDEPAVAEDSTQERTVPSRRVRTPQPVVPEIYQLLVYSLRPNNPPCTDDPNWNRMRKRLRKWPELTLKIVHNPVTVQEEERVVLPIEDGQQAINRILLRTDEINPVLTKYYEDSMGEGAKKIAYRVNNHFVGLNEKSIQKWLNSRQIVQHNRPRFTNKAPLIPIQANQVMERNQIDLVDMQSRPDVINGVTYKYILSVLDVFSRYLFLRPLSSKSAPDVADILASLYNEIGPPDILQHDQGTEFKGAVRKLMSQLRVRVKCSSPYHPQSQGKCERSHPTWKSKLRLQFDELCKNSTYHWADNLDTIARCYNEGLHSSLGMTPFEVFYGRKSNRARNALVIGQTDIPSEEIEVVEEDSFVDLEEETINDTSVQNENIKSIRQAAQKKNNKAAQRMIQRNIKKNPPSSYFKGEKVFIPNKQAKGVNRGGRSIGKQLVHLATILETYPDTYRYQIQYEDGGSQVVKVVSVSELTSVTRGDEQRRQQQALNGTKLSRKRKLKKSKMSYTSESNNSYNMSSPADLVRLCQNISLGIALSLKQPEDTNQAALDRNVREAGLAIAEPRTPRDGNCMFHALAEQLRFANIITADTTYQDLRDQLIKYLTEHQDTASGVHMLNFTGFSTWQEYLNHMSRDSIWGDQIMLIAAANLFHAQITIVSSVSSNPVIIIEPENVLLQDAPVLLLGHLSEFHYYSLENTNSNTNNTATDCTTANIKKKTQGGKRKKSGKNSLSKEEKLKKLDQEYCNQLQSDVLTMTRNDLLTQMDVHTDGHFNTNYTCNKSLDTNFTLLGINDESRYFARLIEEQCSISVPIRNNHYYVLPELMDRFIGIQDHLKKLGVEEDMYLVYIDIVLVFWLYKTKKLHLLKTKADGRFLYLSRVDQNAFVNFKEILLKEWQDMI